MRTVRKRYITSKVAAYFIDILNQAPALILPPSCDFIDDHFNSNLKSAIDLVAPFKIKNNKSKTHTNMEKC